MTHERAGEGTGLRTGQTQGTIDRAATSDPKIPPGLAALGTDAEEVDGLMKKRLSRLPLRTMQGVTYEEAQEIRKVLRLIPTWELLEARELATDGNTTGIALIDRRRLVAISALEEMLAERGELERTVNEQ